jgi:two-component system, LytTR family, sensor kinase
MKRAAPTIPENFEIPEWLHGRLVWHIAFWILYFLPGFLEEVHSGFTQVEDYWKISMINHLHFVSALYITTFFAVPYLLYRKKYLFFGLYSVLVVLGLSALQLLLWNWLKPEFNFKNFKSSDYEPSIFDGFSISLLFVFLAASLKVGKDMLFESKRRSELAAQNLKGELDALRQQMSPHFLLNALNTIYGLAITDAKQVAPTVILLADLLRYSLYETRTDRIPLDRELDFLLDYVQMQQLRASEKLQLTVDFPQNIPPAPPSIGPLLMLVFVENGFKFAQANTTGERFLRIHVRYDEATSTLIFETSNTFLSQSKHEVGGVGLENVKRRLALIYTDKHQLQIHDLDGVWYVKLEIDLRP